jgi:hypothetical protein
MMDGGAHSDQTSFMDPILDGPSFTFRALRPNLRRAQRLAREGAPATARIAGIRIVRGSDEDSPDHHEWALEVRRPTGETFRTGCRQRLSQARLGRLRLGDEVEVLVDGDGHALIAEDGDLGDAQLSHKVLKVPPADGISDVHVDLTKERRKAVAARVVVRDARRTTVLGMSTLNIDLDVAVEPEGEAAFETTLKRELVPFYAQHLVAAGTVLPGTARPGRTDKVRVDWPAAAMAAPGNGVAPALERVAEDAAPVASSAPSSTATSDDWTPAGLAADGDLGVRGGITFDQWVAVSAGLVRDKVKPADVDAYAAQRGVATGGWREAEAAWTSAMMSDPRISTRYGAAFEQARKRRR